MSEESRKVKISCIVTLLIGLLSVAGAVLLIVNDPQRFQVYACLVDGVIALYLGFQGARKINVPSNAGQVRDISAVCVVLTFLLAAYVLVATDKSRLETIIASLNPVMALVCFLFAKQAANVQAAK